ncbi:GlcG/HbpS family heme-binding protein [Hyphococcus sp.]|uniref:GlcG/HbpS family heme-binding protein n=1 Tax=Hyphococcus sp. TaxID=2038636 RepID=UPI003CCC19E9
MSLTLERAQSTLSRALSAANSQNVPVAAVVVDAAGRMVTSARMDGVGYMNISVAFRKAGTSANFGYPTQAMADLASKEPLILAAFTGDSEVMALAGGVPIKDGDQTIGAIGVAGGHYAQDHAIAVFAVGDENNKGDDA